MTDIWTALRGSGDGFVTVQELAHATRLGEDTIREDIKLGILRVTREQRGKRVFFRITLTAARTYLQRLGIDMRQSA